MAARLAWMRALYLEGTRTVGPGLNVAGLRAARRGSCDDLFG